MAAIITWHCFCNKVLTIGMQRVAWPKPQSRGAIKIVGVLLFLIRIVLKLLDRWKNSYFSNNKIRAMKRSLLILVFASVILASCSSAGKTSKGCGCPSKKGLVGY